MKLIRSTGFTLIELMMVVVIIGILGAVAVPNYRSYVVESRIAEGYILMDAIKKGNITYHAEHGVFAGGYLADGADFVDKFQAVMNGEKITSGVTDSIMADIGTVVSPDQHIGFFFHTIQGGYDEINQIDYGNPDGDIKIMYAGITSGSACTSTYYGMKAPEFGVEDGSSDTTYDWFLTAAVANTSYPGSENCVYLVQKVDTHGDGYSTGAIVKLK